MKKIFMMVLVIGMILLVAGSAMAAEKKMTPLQTEAMQIVFSIDEGITLAGAVGNYPYASGVGSADISEKGRQIVRFQVRIDPKKCPEILVSDYDHSEEINGPSVEAEEVHFNIDIMKKISGKGDTWIIYRTGEIYKYKGKWYETMNYKPDIKSVRKIYAGHCLEVL